MSTESSNGSAIAPTADLIVFWEYGTFNGSGNFVS